MRVHNPRHRKAPMVATVAPEVAAYLAQLSRAALIDLAAHLACRCDMGKRLKSCGYQVATRTLDEIRELAEPVLRARGDQLPTVQS
jgi:hypothetical protein